MIIFIIAAIGILFFVIGIALIYRGMVNSSAIDEVVDQKDYEEVRSKLDLVQQEEQGLKLQLDSMTMELQDAKSRAEETEKFKNDVDSLRELDQKNKEMVRQLEESLQFLSRKADQQAQKAIDAINALNSKNQALESEAQSASLSEIDIERLNSEKQSLENQLNENISKILKLEEELKNVQSTSQEELSHAQSVIADLKKQNETFQSGINGIADKISTVELEVVKSREEKERQLAHAKQLIHDLQQEKQELVSRGANSDDVRALEMEIDRVKAESEGRLLEARQNAGRLQEQADRLQREIQENQQHSEELRKQLEDSSAAAVSAMSEPGMTDQKELWLKEKEVFEQELAQLRESNQFLTQKERLLSQELLRSQTQAMGLEKICKEFKKQIERK